MLGQSPANCLYVLLHLHSRHVRNEAGPLFVQAHRDTHSAQQSRLNRDLKKRNTTTASCVTSVLAQEDFFLDRKCMHVWPRNISVQDRQFEADPGSRLSLITLARKKMHSYMPF